MVPVVENEVQEEEDEVEEELDAEDEMSALMLTKRVKWVQSSRELKLRLS